MTALISEEAMVSIAAEVEQLRALVERQKRELAEKDEHIEQYMDLATSYAERITVLHAALLPKLDAIVMALTHDAARLREMEAHIDSISQMVTTLNMRTGV